MTLIEGWRLNLFGAELASPRYTKQRTGIEKRWNVNKQQQHISSSNIAATAAAAAAAAAAADSKMPKFSRSIQNTFTSRIQY
jgi:hypothetical protein